LVGSTLYDLKTNKRRKTSLFVIEKGSSFQICLFHNSSTKFFTRKLQSLENKNYVWIVCLWCIERHLSKMFFWRSLFNQALRYAWVAVITYKYFNKLSPVTTILRRQKSLFVKRDEGEVYASFISASLTSSFSLGSSFTPLASSFTSSLASFLTSPLASSLVSSTSSPGFGS